jgi:hypothetical protein
MESTTGQVLAVADRQGAPVVAMPPEPSLASATGPEAQASELTSDSPQDHGLTALIGALRARELALIDATILKESAVEIAAAVRTHFRDLHLEDVRLDTTLGEARALLQRIDTSVLTSLAGRFMVAGRRLTSARPRERVLAPDATYPSRVKMIRIKPAVSAPRNPKRLVGRVRWGRVLTRGLTLGVLATVLMTLPPETIGNVANNVANEVGPLIGNVANELGSGIGNIANEVSSAISEKLAAAQSAPTLARASFDLPPLSAYGATFESQAPYPTVRPNGTVDWVVALRNTGSVGWYRGIDGAQASLALADGTIAGVQTTAYVGPGQIGWFVVRFPAPSQSGVSKVALLPRIDGRGPLPDLGIYAAVTVSPNP